MATLPRPARDRTDEVDVDATGVPAFLDAVDPGASGSSVTWHPVPLGEPDDRRPRHPARLNRYVERRMGRPDPTDT